MEVSSEHRSQPLGFTHASPDVRRLQGSHSPSPAPVASASTLAPLPAADPRASVQSNGLVRAELESGTIDILDSYGMAGEAEAEGDDALGDGERWFAAHDPSPVHPKFPRQQQHQQHQQQPSTSTSSSGGVNPTIQVISASNSFLDLDDDRRESLAVDDPQQRSSSALSRNDSRRTQHSEASSRYPGRESTFSAMTTGSMDTMDPFQYSQYQGPSSPTERSFQHKHSNSLSPIVELGGATASLRSRTPSPTLLEAAQQHTPPTQPPQQPQPQPAVHPPPPPATQTIASPPRPQYPPRTSSSPRSPPPGGSPARSRIGLGLSGSPVSAAAAAALPTAHSTTSPGRAPSRTPVAKNYSRPMFARSMMTAAAPTAATAPPTPPGVPTATATQSANHAASSLSNGFAPSLSGSMDSFDGVPVSSAGHGEATSASHHPAGPASSLGHSDYGAGSSVQFHAHSLSPAWDERQQQWHSPGPRPSFDRLPLDHSPSLAPGGGRALDGSSQVEEIRNDLDAAAGSPVVSETYGTLYPAGSPFSSHSSAPSSMTSAASPALEVPPPMSRGHSASSAVSAASTGSSGGSHGRNVLRKPRPQQSPPLPHSPPRPAEKEGGGGGGWSSRFRSKKDSPRSPPAAISAPELQSSTVDPRASFAASTTSGYTQASSYAPPTQRDWGLSPDVARQRAMERQRSEQMRLQPGAGKKAGAGFVHRGDEGLAPEWLRLEAGAGAVVGGGPEEEVESLQALGLSSAPRNEGAGKADSVYSDYSYYGIPSALDADSRQPSPLEQQQQQSFQLQQQSQPSLGGSKSLQRQSTTLEKTKLGMSAPRIVRTPAEAQSAEDFLQLGIDFHERGELERAAWCFEQSTKREGGCPAGFLMYGLTLRHGWGCQMQPELGFVHLQRAAEAVLPSLSPSLHRTADKAGGDRKGKHSSLVLQTLPAAEELPDLSAQTAAKTAVTLALYEMGASLRFGWGIAKDKKLAVQYLTLAAELGDVDAQQDAAFMLANGKGAKKDLGKAARFYRMAVQQGAPSFGLSWIYKDKYMRP